jgi:hypothetical protein
VRTGVVLAAVVLLTAIAAGTCAAATPYWSLGKVLRKLDGRAIQVGTRTVRVNSETTLCAGEGASIRRRRVRMWRHFACTYTTFTRAGADRDIDFRVQVRGTSRFAVTDAHWVRGTR